MPSNKELTGQIVKLAKKLGRDVTTDDLNNGQLAELLAELKLAGLRAQAQALAEKLKRDITVDGMDAAALKALIQALKAEAEPNPEAGAEDAAAAKQAVKEMKEKVRKKKAKKPPFYVLPGKAVSCKKGIIDAGGEIRAEWLGGEVEALMSLVERDLVGVGED